MSYKRFNLLLLIFTGNCGLIFSQATSSPYSLFAEGRIEHQITGTLHALGGTGIAITSDYFLSGINPSSLSGLDSQTCLLEAGVFCSYSQYITEDETNNHFNGNLGYLAMGFRLTPWWANSFGIQPYSSVGYKVSTLDNVEGENSYYYKIFEGSGGITQFYWSHSIRPFRNFSAGVSFSYYLGSIYQAETATTADGKINYTINLTQKVHAVNPSFGIQYTLPIGDFKYRLGMIYNDHKDLSTDVSCNISFEGDTFDIETEEQDFYIPRKTGVGIAIEKSYNLKLSFDYEKQFWPENGFSNPLLETRNSECYSFGFQYIPYKGRGDASWKRINFRIGAAYHKTYLIIDNVPVNTTSFMLGAGIPAGKELTMINVSLEAGRTGTMRKSLLQEDYLLMHVNFTLHDKWFRKYKYD